MRGVGGAPPLDSDGFAALVDPFALPERVAVGVSGGGDSTALLVLVADWARNSGRQISALTVDHGIRPESVMEAACIAALCRTLDVAHHTLSIVKEAPETGIQEWARTQRFKALARWSREQGGVPVMLAHTVEDQAETVMMRLLRGAGVDGLAAMRADSRHGNLRVVRPLLSVSRERLRSTLRERGRSWIEDPSNHDTRFERVRVREAMRVFGLDAAPLARTAASMERVRFALEAETVRLLQRCASRGVLGEVVLDLQGLRDAEAEFAIRAVARVIGAVGGNAGAGIRRASLDGVFCWAVAPGASPPGCTLSGCVLRKASKDRLLILREPAMCNPPFKLGAGQEAVWDGRWRVWFGGPGSVEVGALGRSGARGLGDVAASWRRSPAIARATVPAFRACGRIVAVPHAGFWLEGHMATAGAETIEGVC